MTETEIWDTQQTAGTDVLTCSWQGKVIAKRHAFKPVIDQILKRHLNTDLFGIGLIGKSSSGKTTLAKDIMHVLHQKISIRSRAQKIRKEHKEVYQKGYHYRILKKDDLVRFNEIIADMPRTNRIIYFDDLSFLESIYGHKAIGQLKNMVTEIRHIDEELSVNTILMYGYHYSKGFDKFLRDNDYKFYFSISDEELGNITEQIQATPEQKKILQNFKTISARFKEEEQITLQLSRRQQEKYGSVTYQYSDPFRLLLFYNGTRLRPIVFPKFEWLAGNCSICQNLAITPKKKNSRVSNAKLRNWLLKRYTKDTVEKAVQILAYTKYGKFHRNKDTMQLFAVLDRLIENGATSHADLVKSVLGKNYLEMALKRSSKRGHADRVSGTVKDDFMLITGIDGLKGPNDKARSKKDIKAQDPEGK